MALNLKAWTVVAGGSGYGAGFQNGATLASVFNPMAGSPATTGSPISIWDGAATDQDNKRLVLCANGGHGDYWGNEIYALELNTSAPYWRQLADASPISAYSTNPPNATNVSNAADLYWRCAAMHTANTQQYLDGKIWTMQQSSYADQGSSSGAVYSYNLRDANLVAANAAGHSLAFTTTSGPWSYIGIPSAWDGTGSFGCSAADKVGHKVYGFTTDQSNTTTSFYSVDTYTGALASYTSISTGVNFQSGAAACAYDLRLICLLGQNGQIYTIDISTPGSPLTPQAISVSGWTVDAGNPTQSCVFNGSISGTTLTVTSVTRGTIAVGQTIFGTGIAVGTGITGGSGTSWTVSIPQSVANEQITTAQAQSMGMVYHRPSSSIFVYNADLAMCANGTIVKIKIPRNTNGTYNASGTWVASSISPGAGSATVGSQYSPSNGTYSKFNLIENVGNGQGMIVLCLGLAAGYTWVYKLPAGELI